MRVENLAKLKKEQNSKIQSVFFFFVGPNSESELASSSTVNVKCCKIANNR